MAAMAMGRLADRRHFLGIVHDLNKNKFHEKKRGSFLHTNGIVLLAANSSKGKIISVSHVTDGIF